MPHGKKGQMCHLHLDCIPQGIHPNSKTAAMQRSDALLPRVSLKCDQCWHTTDDKWTNTAKMKGLPLYFCICFNECFVCCGCIFFDFNIYNSWHSVHLLNTLSTLSNCSSVLHLHPCRYVYLLSTAYILDSKKIYQSFKLKAVLYIFWQNNFNVMLFFFLHPASFLSKLPSKETEASSEMEGENFNYLVKNPGNHKVELSHWHLTWALCSILHGLPSCNTCNEELFHDGFHLHTCSSIPPPLPCLLISVYDLHWCTLDEIINHSFEVSATN